MNPIRKCCGYYCAFVMFIGIFFYIILIILELTHNQFVFNKLQEFPEGTVDLNLRWPEIKQMQID